MGHTCPITGKRVLRYEEIFSSFDLWRGVSREVDTGRSMAQDVFEAAALAVRSSIIDEAVDLHLDLGCGQFAVSASSSCGQTFLYVINRHYPDFTMPGALDLQMVGPASMFDCYRALAAGEPVTVECEYVAEAAQAFGADPVVVHAELVDYLATGNTPIAERIVCASPADPRVHVRGDWYETVALAYKVLDNPDLRRFCKHGVPDLEQAVEMTDQDRRQATRENISTHSI
ncbi:hypothetical protein [Rhizobium sp. BK176]|uniref:hypothetical protein n=1 Tax=Rhizobium sp. BK176 TaxID=2587071 RepID=UPI002167CFF3|nr:hypothetical protein [Rhizobium sp. BK176]MCS4090108.1 hypothetical protein [Rhizobium sp. BK176]